MEALLQQGFHPGEPLYFAAIFSASVIYYTYAYMSEGTIVTSNPRTLWYKRNKKMIRRSQGLMAVVLTASLVALFWKRAGLLFRIGTDEWLWVLIFPLSALCYYGLSEGSGRYSLRRIGWLKPFVIGLIWAGIVTIYPVLFQGIIKGTGYSITLIGTFLFIKNFMFVSVLCIMFDIKDYAVDYNAQLKTFVVKVGLRRTIFQIIMPLCFAGLVSFLAYGVFRGFHPLKLVLNVIPFLLLIVVAYSLHNRKSVLYYLIIIDGLMLVKAVCGSIAMIYF